jgi:spermidine synthase
VIVSHTQQPIGRRRFTGDGFALALVIALVSGAGALIHQLLWMRRLVDLLGASHESIARVVGFFFLGLATGAAVAAWSHARVRRPWRWVVAIECAVVALSLPAITLPWWTGWIWPALGVEGLIGWRGSAAKWAVSILVVFPPATAMGMTLPLIGLAVLRGRATLGRHGVWLYAINTFGGVVGLAVATLWLLHRLGAAGTMWVGVACSVLVIALASFAAFREPGRPPQEETLQPPGAARSGHRGMSAALSLAFLSGFVLLALEVAALQAMMFIAPLSFYAPAAMLMVIITLLALGAAVTPLLTRRPGSADQLLRRAMLLAGVCMTASPLGLFAVLEWSDRWTPPTQFGLWFLELAAIMLMVLGPALAIGALIFPAVLARVEQHGDDPHGRRWGWLLATNGLGGLLGAEVAYRALLPTLGPHVTIGCLGVLYVAVSLVLVAFDGRVRRWGTIVYGGAVAATVVVVVLWLPQLPVVETHGQLEVVEARTGREGTVAVVDLPDGGRSLLMANQYVLGSTNARLAQERQAHLPLLLHPQPRRVAAIGLATGITPGAALVHDIVEELTVIELSPLVVELARDHFEPFQHGLFTDPRTRVVIEDGRTVIAAAAGRFDVVLGDLYLPWGPGEARLYTREHFEAVRRSLRPGGVFCQWLAAYQLTPEQFDIIATTFQRVFPQTFVVISDFDAYPAIGLVGFRDGQWDWATIESRLVEARATGWDDRLLRSRRGVSMLAIGELQPLPSGTPINTLDNMRIELDAGRLHVVADPGETYLFGRRWREWLDTLLVFRPAEW